MTLGSHIHVQIAYSITFVNELFCNMKVKAELA